MLRNAAIYPETKDYLENPAGTSRGCPTDKLCPAGVDGIQKVNHFASLGTAVDIITQNDLDRMGNRVGDSVAINARENAL
jgi:hypothetical protein